MLQPPVTVRIAALLPRWIAAAVAVACLSDPGAALSQSTIFAGAGRGDGGAATAAPHGIAVDASNNLYLKISAP